MQRVFLSNLALLLIGCVVSFGKQRPLNRNLSTQPGTKYRNLLKTAMRNPLELRFKNLKTGAEILINEHVSFHAASTMKVPVMLELYRQSAAGKFSLDDKVAVKNEFHSIVDDSIFTLYEKSDGDPDAYKLIGSSVTYRELIQRMITRSSNLATNILIEKIGADNVMKLMKQMNANDIRVLRGVEDNKAFGKGLNNTTTAYDLMILLKTIAEKKAVSPTASDEMIKTLLGQEFNTGIPAGLPEGTKVAHKTGSITKIRHDAAIVYPEGRSPYILIVLTKGIEDEKKSDKLIADISRAVYQSITTK